MFFCSFFPKGVVDIFIFGWTTVVHRRLSFAFLYSTKKCSIVILLNLDFIGQSFVITCIFSERPFLPPYGCCSFIYPFIRLLNFIVALSVVLHIFWLKKRKFDFELLAIKLSEFLKTSRFPIAFLLLATCTVRLSLGVIIVF